MGGPIAAQSTPGSAVIRFSKLFRIVTGRITRPRAMQWRLVVLWRWSGVMSVSTQNNQAEIFSIEGREVRISHPDKLYFTRQVKISKSEIVKYYLAVAPGALQGIQDRPIVLKRF